MSAVVSRNPDVLWREEEEAAADALKGLETGADIENIGTSVLFCGGSMLALNYLGTEIWKMCDGQTLDGIVARLLAQFEVDEAVLRQDVAAFIDELAGKGFIRYE